MKFRRIVATVVVLAMMLVCLPVQARAEEQRATLVPRTMEQVKSITTIEDGVFSCTTFDEVLSFCYKASSNPFKDYVVLYTGSQTLEIPYSLTIPQNLMVATYYGGKSTGVKIKPGATVNLNGHLESDFVYVEGALNISSGGTLLTEKRLELSGNVYVDGTIAFNGGSNTYITGKEFLSFGENGVVILTTSVSTEDSFVKTCTEASNYNNGHWAYVLELKGGGFSFSFGTATIPSNCSCIVSTPFYFGNVDMDVYGYIDSSSPLIVDGNLRLQPGSALAIGSAVAVRGTLENYSEILVVSGVNNLNGQLVLENPQNYKDADGFKRGVIIVATQAGNEYPEHALVDMDVNHFLVEWLQNDGKSYWVLASYSHVEPGEPDTPQEAELIASGSMEEGKQGWEIYSDGTLKIYGAGSMPTQKANSYPWMAFDHLIKRIEITGITSIAAEAFSGMSAVSSIFVGDTVTRIGKRAFADSVSLESVTISANVEEIEESAFAGCASLKEVFFAENSKLQRITTRMFEGAGIIKIELPLSVIAVDKFAFAECKNLTEIVFAEDMEYMENNAFAGCTALEKIIFKSDWAPFFETDVFKGLTADAYYPVEYTDSWDYALKDYGGKITWIPYCLNHTYTTEVVEPDCIHPGTTTHTCSVCGDIQVESEQLPPQGHDYGLDEDGKNPDFWDTTCDVCGAERVVDKHRPTHSMYRMYNPNSGEHFYTGSMEERKNLEAEGWKYEGVGFTFPASTGKPVYRLYDKDNTMEHLYTMDEAEKDKLLAEGWVLEGVAFNSGREDEVPQYRLHNPNATIGAYHFTASVEEKDMLIAAGWEYQGIGFYTCLQ